MGMQGGFMLIKNDFNYFNDTLVGDIANQQPSALLGIALGNKKSFFATLTFNFFMYQKKNSFGIKTFQSTKRYNLELYYSLNPQKKINFYPFIGTTIAQTSVKLLDNDGKEINPATAQNLFGPKSITFKQNFLVDVGLMINFLKKDTKPNSKKPHCIKSNTLGIKVGYSIPTLKTAWYYGDSKINTQRTILLSGVFLGISITLL